MFRFWGEPDDYDARAAEHWAEQDEAEAQAAKESAEAEFFAMLDDEERADAERRIAFRPTLAAIWCLPTTTYGLCPREEWC